MSEYTEEQPAEVIIICSKLKSYYQENKAKKAVNTESKSEKTTDEI